MNIKIEIEADDLAVREILYRLVNELTKYNQAQDKPEPPPLVDIRDIPMSAGLRNILICEGIHFIEELGNYTKYDVMNFYNLGKGSFEEVSKIMREYEVHFRGVSR